MIRILTLMQQHWSHRYPNHQENSKMASQRIPVNQFDQQCAMPEMLPFQHPSSAANEAPRAHITLIHTPHGIQSRVTKFKRRRTAFTTDQIEILEREFKKRPYIGTVDRQNLMSSLNVDEKVIRTWFQNRRLKEKRQPSCVSSSDAKQSVAEAETRLKVKLANGHVSLEDQDVVEVFRLIDPNILDIIDVSPSAAQESPVYEPVSPAEFPVNDENLVWRPCDLNGALQGLIDMEPFMRAC